MMQATVTHTTVTGGQITMREYWELTNQSRCSAFGEGFTTYTHPLYTRWEFTDPEPLKVPSLVVFPEEDALYRWLHQEWLLGHHGSDLVKAPGQAHCMADPGWEETVAAPLGDWLDELPPRRCAA